MTKSYFEQVELPDFQIFDNGVVFPTVLFPNPNTTSQLSTLTDAIQAHKPWLESLLQQSGALLFRGFPVTSPSDFNDVVEAFGFPEMPYVGGGAVRLQVLGRVLTANESPPEQRIHFHSEMAHASSYPTKIFFFCEVEPGRGGETAVVPSHVVYNRMRDRYPEFVEKLEEHGVLYSRPLAEEDDSSSLVGRGWKSTFCTNDKGVAEQRAAELGMKLEWRENVAIIKTDPMPAIKFDKEMQRKTWFNGFAVAYGSPDAVKRYEPDLLPTLGNGEALPADIMYNCSKIMDEEMVAIPWQKGDILLIDNLKVLHSRLALISPPRRILASLCK